MGDMPGPNETDSIDCHLQVLGMGTLLCRTARQTGKDTTNEVSPSICFNCAAGSIFRELGCDAVSPKIWIHPHGSSFRVVQLFCRVRKRLTTIEYCRTCGLATSETTREIISQARGLFGAQGFYSAYQDLEKAREAIRDGNCENAVTRSVSCLESAMRICHERLGKPLPSDKQVTGLWKSTRGLLSFDGMDGTGSVTQLLNALAGVVASAASLRNSLDAHGRGTFQPEVSENIAELAINTASTVATAIVRRYNQLQEACDGPDSDPSSPPA